MGHGKPAIGKEVVHLAITDAHDGQRIDNFLVRELKGVPKSRIYRLLRKGEVRVNKARIKAEYKLREGDVVRIPPVKLAARGLQSPLSPGLHGVLEAAVLYEDDRLLVVNKPSGLAVHGGSGINLGLIEALRRQRPQQKFLELVHRLDRDTSGCVMVAKKRSMLRHLHAQLQQGAVEKRYLALVQGRWPRRRQVVNAPLQKNVVQSGERMVRVSEEGKPSVTRFAVLECYPGATLVEARPVSGRTHQIRVHARHAGHPLLGDDKYSDEAGAAWCRAHGLKRLFLHAAGLTVPLPEDAGEVVVEAPLPEDLAALLQELRAAPAR